jgi:hypothetical protein
MAERRGKLGRRTSSGTSLQAAKEKGILLLMKYLVVADEVAALMLQHWKLKLYRMHSEPFCKNVELLISTYVVQCEILTHPKIGNK